MIQNMGRTDRVLRMVAAFVIGLLLDRGMILSPWAVVASIIALALFITSVIGFCPVYFPFRFSTNKTRPGSRG